MPFHWEVMSKKHSMLLTSFPTEWAHLIFIHHGGPPSWITQSRAAREFVELQCMEVADWPTYTCTLLTTKKVELERSSLGQKGK